MVHLKKINYLNITKDEIRIIFERFPKGHPDFIPLLLGYRCGLRLGEAFGILLEDIDLNNGYIHIQRQIQFDESCNELYFTEPKYYSYKYIKSICEKYDMSLQDFLMYVVQNAFYDTTPYENVLSQKKKIWIGQAQLSPKFSEDNIQLIYDVSKRDCN